VADRGAVGGDRQAIGAAAHDDRSIRNVMAITYLIAGKLDLKPPTRNSGEPEIIIRGHHASSMP
jgi:hypothetical protein